jgi:glutamine synthetase
MVAAIPALTTDKAIDIFTKHKVYSEVELRSRSEIQYELYSKAINIEAKTMVEMANKLFIPAVIKYTTTLANNIVAVKSAVATADVSVQTELLTKTSALLAEAKAALVSLTAVVAKAAETEEGHEQATFFRETVVPAMAALRAPIDALEIIVDKDAWPVPTYGDLLFEV